MRPALGIDVNRKIQLKLSEDASAKSYTCLVKKVKEHLVALVISNKDKGKVNPAVGEKLFLLNEWEDDYWVTPVSLIQNNSFPLIILKVVEEPYSVIGGGTTPPPAPIEGIDSITDDHNAEDKNLVMPVDLSEEPVIVPASARAPEDTPSVEEIWSQEKDAGVRDDLDLQGDGTGIDELVEERLEDIEASADNSKPEETDQMEPLRADLLDSQIVEEEILDEIAEVEPSPLSGVDEDIPGDLGDMTIIADSSIDISDISDDEEESVETHIGDEEEKTPSEATHEERFDDNFVIFLTPIDRGMMEEAMESIKSPDEKPSGESPVTKDYAIDLPEGLDPSAREIMETLTSHILNIEKTMEELKKNVSSPFFNPLGEPTSALCVSLSDAGMTVVMDDPPREGADFLISADRPWKPALKFKATAIVDSVKDIDGVAAVKISFTAIHPQSVASINNYLNSGAKYFELIDKFRQA